MTAIRQKIVWKSGMCTRNRGLNNLHRKSLLKISDVYTGFVEIGGRESRRSGIQIVIGGCDGRVRDRAELRYKLVWRRDGVVGMGLRKIWSVLRQRVYQHFAPRLITGCTLS